MTKILLLCLLLCAHGMTYAQQERGELLYDTHCNACHGPEMHQRSQRIATDWASLLVQVRRWESNIGLNWSQEEITDVAHFLNERYYGFYEPGNHTQDEQIDHAQSKPE